MINKFKALIQKVVSGQEAETQTTLLQKKASTFNVECAIDEEVVDCEGEAFKQDAINYYTGVPAPAYLENDPWFGPAYAHYDMKDMIPSRWVKLHNDPSPVTPEQ